MECFDSQNDAVMIAAICYCVRCTANVMKEPKLISLVKVILNYNLFTFDGRVSIKKSNFISHNCRGGFQFIVPFHSFINSMPKKCTKQIEHYKPKMVV